MLTPIILLKSRTEFWGKVKDERVQWRDLLPILGFIVVACSMYGAVMAGWRSTLLSLFVAIKLPLLFLATTALVSLFNWMISSLLGARLTFRTTIFAVFGAMCEASWILLSLTPVSFFFLISVVPSVGTDNELRLAHNYMLLTHIGVLAMAGIAGNAALFSGLRELVSKRSSPRALFLTWLLAFAFVGCQMSWILRPFVGSPFYPVEFMRPDCFERNFYEFVGGEVLPFVLKGGN